MSSLLIVDDNVSVRNALVRVLAPRGFELSQAALGSEALELVESRVPDLVLCDLVLPDLDGFELCRRLRQKGHLRSVPVLILATRDDAEIRERVRLHGAQGLIAKPISADAVLDAVLQGLAGSTLAGQAPAQRLAGRPLWQDAHITSLSRALREVQLEPGTVFVLVNAFDGERLAERLGPAAGIRLARRRVEELMQLASSLDVAVRSGGGERLTLEADDATLLVDSLPSGDALSFCVDSTVPVGKARLYQRQLRLGLEWFEGLAAQALPNSLRS
ncbi:MAG TPA: response regulator [Thermoanaerobaculia bacterium]|nr:response regulator [Thermoanaerobaculia bacterium]